MPEASGIIAQLIDPAARMADLSSIPWNRFPPDARPHDRVSRNFAFRELTVSELARKRRIDNRFPGAREARAAVYLCRRVLQPLRDAFGPFTPNSVFRSQALERALKNMPADWVSTSQHALGEACDLTLPGVTTLELADWIARHLEFDKLILECHDPAKGPSSGWVHVSLRAPGAGANRGEQLSYVWNRRRRRFVYVEGLRASA
jgi:hypothetical protein